MWWPKQCLNFFFKKSPDFEAFQFSPFNLSFVHIKQAVMAEERLDVKLNVLNVQIFFLFMAKTGACKCFISTPIKFPVVNLATSIWEVLSLHLI